MAVWVAWCAVPQASRPGLNCDAPPALDREDAGSLATMFGRRCALRNSARGCTVGTILAGDDAAYDGLRWSGHFASSDTTKENQNEDEGDVSCHGCVVARAIYFRV